MMAAATLPSARNGATTHPSTATSPTAATAGIDTMARRLFASSTPSPRSADSAHAATAAAAAFMGSSSKKRATAAGAAAATAPPSTNGRRDSTVETGARAPEASESAVLLKVAAALSSNNSSSKGSLLAALAAADPAGDGSVPTPTFAECLRGALGSAAVSRSDRRVLYSKYSQSGRVDYAAFLEDVDTLCAELEQQQQQKEQQQQQEQQEQQQQRRRSSVQQRRGSSSVTSGFTSGTSSNDRRISIVAQQALSTQVCT
jgi:hypothetical protein